MDNQWRQQQEKEPPHSFCLTCQKTDRRHQYYTTNQKQSRPSSGRSNPGSRPSSSRDNSVSGKPPVAKGCVSDRSVSRNNISKSGLSSRTESEPNLFVKEGEQSCGSKNEIFDRTDGDNSNYLDKNRLINGFGDAELTNYSNLRTSSNNELEHQVSNIRSGVSDQSETSIHHADQSKMSTKHGDQSETRSSRLLEADAFDRLADQIASRVKAEMRQERQDVRQSSGRSPSPPKKKIESRLEWKELGGPLSPVGLFTPVYRYCTL